MIYDAKNAGGYRLLYDCSPQVMKLSAGMARFGLMDPSGELLWGVSIAPELFEALCRKVAENPR